MTCNTNTICHSLRTSPMETSTDCVRWCISGRRELFLSHITDRNTDGHIPSMYSRGEGNCSPITDENTDEHKPSVFYRGEGNCSNITDGNTDDLCSSVFFSEVKGTVHIPCRWCQLKTSELVAGYRENYRWTIDGLCNLKRG